MRASLYCGDCLEILPTIASESVDAVITDPPYPCIKRDYGTWTVDEWWALIVEGVVPEVRRILKPTGSAVFILQPNSEHVGQMRGWLWEFMAWVCREWNMVQDVWWWNYTAVPTGLCAPRERGLLRASVKAGVWAGAPNCYRDQARVLWEEADRTKADRKSRKCWRIEIPSGQGVNEANFAAIAAERGGVTPFNLLPLASNRSGEKVNGHSAGTPLKLADWWARYICPPGRTVLDPFVGSGTMMLAAIQNGCNGIGIDRERRYIDIAQQRITAAQHEAKQLEMAI